MPCRGDLESASVAYASGDFGASVELLSSHSSPEAVTLRARSLVRLGLDGAALAELSRVKQLELSNEMAAEVLAIEAHALYATQRAAEADILALEARAQCYSAGFVGIEAELLFASAIGALIEEDDKAAEAAVSAILSLDDSTLPWSRPSKYRLPLSFWRARACDIHGAIEYARGNRSQQAYWFRRAFDELDRSGVRDDFFETALLANYADASITSGLNEIADFVVERADKIKWTSPLVGHEFRLFSALAEAASIQGDQIGALRHFRRCLNCAPNAPLQVRASVERARLLSQIGETFSSREELDHATRLSKSIDWASVGSIEQRQLVFLAAQTANYQPLEAQRLMELYDRLNGSASPVIAIKDERFRGEEYLARAAVLSANGQRDRAVILLLDALSIWTSAGYASQAAFAAAELAELTHEPHYVEIAKAESRKQPLSILARKMARYDANMLRPPASTNSFESLVPAVLN